MFNTKTIGLMLAAFAAGSFFASPLPEAIASTIANDVICNGCVGTSDLAGNAVTAAKIKDSEVKAAEIASGAVGSSEIANGSITSADVSTGFVKVVNLVDTDCGCEGKWDPNGALQNIVVDDSKVTAKSVISLTMTGGYSMVCTANLPQAGDFTVSCSSPIPDGFGLSYVVINK